MSSVSVDSNRNRRSQPRPNCPKQQCMHMQVNDDVFKLQVLPLSSLFTLPATMSPKLARRSPGSQTPKLGLFSSILILPIGKFSARIPALRRLPVITAESAPVRSMVGAAERSTPFAGGVVGSLEAPASSRFNFSVGPIRSSPFIDRRLRLVGASRSWALSGDGVGMGTLDVRAAKGVGEESEGLGTSSGRDTAGK